MLDMCTPHLSPLDPLQTCVLSTFACYLQGSSAMVELRSSVTNATLQSPGALPLFNGQMEVCRLFRAMHRPNRDRLASARPSGGPLASSLPHLTALLPVWFAPNSVITKPFSSDILAQGLDRRPHLRQGAATGHPSITSRGRNRSPFPFGQD